MSRTLSLAFLLGLCLAFSSAQFLPLDSEDFLNPMEIEFTNQEDFDDEQFQADTPQQIEEAVSQNIAAIFKLMMEGAAGSIRIDSINQEVSNTEDLQEILEFRDGQIFVRNMLQGIARHSEVIGDAMGTLVVNGMISFQDAQANGEDVGAAVSKSVAEIIRDLDSNAGYIGEALQEDIDEAMADLETVSEEVVLFAGELEEGIERFIGSISGHADAIGDFIGAAVNEGVAKGRNAAETIGAIFGSLFLGLSEKAESAGDAVAEAVVEALTGLDGATQEDLEELREEVRKFIAEQFREVAKYGTEIEEFIPKLIIRASNGFNNEGKAKDAVEVINRIGRFVVQSIQTVINKNKNK